MWVEDATHWRRAWLPCNEGKRKCAQNLNFSSLATRAGARYFMIPLMSISDANLYLVGFMGTGKTTVGRITAQRLGVALLDSDHEIERLRGKPVARIFAEEGEAVFRSLEREFIERGHPSSRTVVACGGGLVTQPGLLELLQKKGVVICLQASIETIL